MSDITNFPAGKFAAPRVISSDGVGSSEPAGFSDTVICGHCEKEIRDDEEFIDFPRWTGHRTCVEELRATGWNQRGF